ncbi:MAG TPA: YkgJ family cysteine cluster protein [Bryobacteraceae bacterium]|nr:YkgJ family cysteine cluster protein [Bryobacteraceae bacterium]
MGANFIGDANKPETHFNRQDRAFVALIDGAFADAATRSGPHLLCRPGCTQCCIGAFAIGPADALRLKKGLAALQHEDPERAARVRGRAAASWSRLAPQFPGNAHSGALDLDGDGGPSERFDGFANDEPCPALDPEHGTCDLYASRPQTCRVFGPPIAAGEGYGVCELCFHGASPQEIADGAIASPADDLSTSLDQAAIAAGESAGATIVAFVLRAG